jgi:type IV pilus assembly protein PilB
MTDTSPMDAAELPKPLGGTRMRVSLGAILVREGHITVERLEEALAGERASGRRLGEILVDLGWVSAHAVAQALAEQHGLDYLDLACEEIDQEASKLLPEAFARRYQALPIRFVGPELVLVAVVDPTDVVASDGLRLALGLNVRVAVAAATDLEEVLTRAYREPVEIDAAAFVSEEDEAAPEESAVAARAPAVRLVNSLIARAVADGASDVHFEPQEDDLVVRIRVDGVLRRLASLPKSMQATLTARLKVIAGLDIAERRLPQDGRLMVRVGAEPVDLRVAVVPTTFGEQVVLRILRRAAVGLGLPSLGMAAEAEKAFVRAIRQPYGAVVVCGPTGSGKTTTLYAALQLLNDEERALMTIEDPVEQHVPGVVQVEVTPRGPLTFPLGLRTILRSDPDVLLVGEIRDEETARIAVQAAMTGHLVLTTLHTHDASSSIARLRDMGVEPHLLASSLNCIVAQRLARRLCGDCRVAFEPSAEERREAGLAEDREALLYRPGGCVRCAGLGYRGRVALYEVMPVRGELRRLLTAPTEEILAAALAQGMTTLAHAGMHLCREGISSLEEIRRVIGEAPS